MEKESGLVETFLFNIQLRIICNIRTGRKIKGKKTDRAVSVKAGILRAVSFHFSIGGNPNSSFCEDEVMMQD